MVSFLPYTPYLSNPKPIYSPSKSDLGMTFTELQALKSKQ